MVRVLLPFLIQLQEDYIQHSDNVLLIQVDFKVEEERKNLINLTFKTYHEIMTIETVLQ